MIDEISRLQALAANHMCLGDVEAMRQVAKADINALRLEVGQLNSAEAAQTHSPQAAQAAIPP
jgi:hypothetical protein